MQRALTTVCLMVAFLGIVARPSFAATAHNGRANASTASVLGMKKPPAAGKSLPQRRSATRRASAVRDSIGRPVVRPQLVPSTGAGKAWPVPRLQARSIGTSLGPSNLNRSGGLGLTAPAVPRLEPALPRPFGGVATANRGRINGAGLIRPGLAPSVLGGPAKPTGGIDGTTFKIKR